MERFCGSELAHLDGVLSTFGVTSYDAYDPMPRWNSQVSPFPRRTVAQDASEDG